MAEQILGFGDVLQAMLVVVVVIGIVVMPLYYDNIEKWWRKHGKNKKFY